MSKETLLRPREILTEADVRQFFSDCFDFFGRGFHIDTDGSDYGMGRGQTFTTDEAREFNRLMDLAVMVVDDPYEIAVQIMQARDL